MYDRMLLANDGSDLSEEATRYAAVWGSILGSEVLVLRASEGAGQRPETLTWDSWAALIAPRPEPSDADREEAYPPLSTSIAALRAGGVRECGSLLLHGDPAPTLLAAVERLGCDLVVMSTHGTRGIRRAVLGSVADQVIRHAGVPVLLCPPPTATTRTRRCDRILVTVDGTTTAETLMPHAREIALRSGAAVTLLRVIQPAFDILSMSTPPGTPVPVRLTPEAAQDAAQAQRLEAEEQMRELSEVLLDAGLASVTGEIVEGDPVPTILQLAEETDADLVLIATRARGGLGRALLGSVTDEVTRQITTAPVLIVPPRGA